MALIIIPDSVRLDSELVLFANVDFVLCQMLTVTLGAAVVTGQLFRQEQPLISGWNGSTS